MMFRGPGADQREARGSFKLPIFFSFFKEVFVFGSLERLPGLDTAESQALWVR